MTYFAALKNRIEGRTGVLWGFDTGYANRGNHPHAYIRFNRKSSGYVRVEGGIGSRGFYLTWGH